MGSLARTALHSPSCFRSQIAVPILLLASGLITAPAQTRIVTTVAGMTHSVSGNGGPASQATVNYPEGVALDAKGNLYIADSVNSQVRKIDASTGVMTVVAGTGQYGFSGDGQLAVNAQLSFPEDVAVDSGGNIYIADTWNQVIRKVSAVTGIISTIAGTPDTSSSTYAGDGGPATKVLLDFPLGVAVDSSGNVFIADSDHGTVREVNAATGIITTYAGTPGGGVPGGDGGAATSAVIAGPKGLAFDVSGNLYISGGCVIREVTKSNGIITTYAGSDTTCGYSGDSGIATSAELGPTVGHISLDSAGNLYIADYYNNAIRKVAASTGIISTIAGKGSFGFSGDGGLATYAALNNPTGVAVAGDGSIYIADMSNLRIREITSSGTISTIAGNGTSGPISSGPATATPLGLYGFRWYSSVTTDASGNLYFADSINNVIRKMTAAGVISTIAGTGVAGYSGDGGPAITAELNNPDSVAFDAQGNLYIADSENNVIRKVDTSGNISTYAGTYAQYSTVGYALTVTGDGGPATSAGLPDPTGIAVDSTGNLYIADQGWGVVRKVTPAGIISTYAGKVSPTGFSDGDGGPATSADLSGFTGSIALDSQGNLYLGDYTTVRKVTASTGIITTIAGIQNDVGDSGDGGPAVSATLFPVYGLAVDAGNVYVADSNTVRMVNSAGIISTVAGTDNKTGYSGDGGVATSALISPDGVTADPSGNIYFTDSLGNRIRKVSTGSVQSDAGTPEFSPAPGAFGSNPTVTVTTATPGAQIFYTLDGSTPNPSTSPLYSGPVSLVAPVTLSAIAIAPGYSTSATTSGLYTTGQKSQTITFGALPNVTYGVSPITLGATASSGLQVTYTVAGPAIVNGSTLSLTGAGRVMVTASQTGDSNYIAAASVSQSFTAAQAPLTVTADNASMTIGGPLPVFTYTITGWVNHDGEGNIAGSTFETTTATITSPPGTYPITFSTEGLSSTNYTFTYVNGTLTIAPAPAAAVTLSPTSLTFSSQALGSTSVAQTITLTNSGNAPLSIISTQVVGNFSESDNCGGSVAAGANCTLSVTFAPTSGGSLTGSLTITDNALNSPQRVSLNGTGSTVSVSTTSTGMTVSSVGGSATANIQVSSAGGFSGMVNFTCSVAYQGTGTPQDPPTCTLSPAQGQVSTVTPATTTLTINTTAASARLNNPWLPLGGGALAAVVVFVGVPRRRWYKMGLLALLGLITAGATFGCGGGSSTSSSSGGGGTANPGTTSGSYVVTVTATSAADSTQTVSVTITLSVS